MTYSDSDPLCLRPCPGVVFLTFSVDGVLNRAFFYRNRTHTPGCFSSHSECDLLGTGMFFLCTYTVMFWCISWRFVVQVEGTNDGDAGSERLGPTWEFGPRDC